MRALKIFSAAALALVLARPALGQSLTEAAKKEKERRESLKGKAGVVVTNADLSGTKKKPAVAPQAPAEGEKPAAAPAAKAAEPFSGGAVPSVDLGAEAKKKYDEKKTELEGGLSKAKEMVELLNLKMGALWQQFYSFNSMSPKNQIQKQISETHLRLQAAQAEEKKLKDDLDQFLAQGSKGPFPAPAIK